MVLAAASIVNPDYVPETWHVFLLTSFIMIVHSCMASAPTKWIAKINEVGSTFNMIALVVVIIIIPTGNNRPSQGLPRFTSSSDVWGTISNTTDWPAGISVLMSFTSVIWTMSGYDAPFHLAEECANANIAAPRAIVMTSAMGGIFGWFLQLVVAYTVVDIPAALESDIGQPFAAYLVQVMPQKIVLAVLSLTIIAGFAMGQGCMVSASRVTFAYARDDCFPLSRVWKVVNKHTKTPVNAVWLNCAVGISMTLLMFAGPVAIGAIFSIGACAAFVAFTIPIFLRVFFVGNKFRRGPFHLGRFSIPVGVVACMFVALMVPVLNLPSVDGNHLNAATMNWTCVVYGSAMSLILLWWFVSARHWFKGPKVNIAHRMLGEPVVLEGVSRDENVGSHEGVSIGITKDGQDFDYKHSQL
jgi:amino acid transporter